ncbi:hypothetical protein J6590_047851 [Homalodisca vitripennis]|nr:hypothetical protein J6590_047851 [Homalodisca vitripennis]
MAQMLSSDPLITSKEVVHQRWLSGSQSVKSLRKSTFIDLIDIHFDQSGNKYLSSSKMNYVLRINLLHHLRRHSYAFPTGASHTNMLAAQ